MRLTQVKHLLDDNKINYTVSKVDNRGNFYRRKGFKDTKVSHSFTLLTIPNPNHHLGIELIFISDNENPEFYDMEFGGYWHELFDLDETWYENELVNEIKNIMSGKVYYIFKRDAETGAWRSDSQYHDFNNDEMNSMAAYYKEIEKIHAPKTWLEKLKGKTMKYEIYNWTNYECVIK